MITEEGFKKLSIAIFVLVLVILSFIVLRPIMIAIVSGMIIGFVFLPVNKKVLVVVKEKNISALIVCLIVLFLIFIPIWFLFPVIIQQIYEAYMYFQELNFSEYIAKIFPALQKDIVMGVNNILGKVASFITGTLSDALIDLPNMVLQFVVVLFVFFFTIRDADKLKKQIDELPFFNKNLQTTITSKFKDVTGAVIYGFVVVGTVQGLLTGVGLFVAGVPNVLLLTILAIFLSIIPFTGAWFVWFPAAVFLLINGKVGAGVGLMIYGALFLAWIDNILRSVIVAKRTNVPSSIVFVGMIGGLMVFGIIGLIIGPLVLAYLLTVLELYKQNKLFT